MPPATSANAWVQVVSAVHAGGRLGPHVSYWFVHASRSVWLGLDGYALFAAFEGESVFCAIRFMVVCHRGLSGALRII